jgi:arylsulfatase A
MKHLPHLCALLLALPFPCHAAEKARRPNFIYILADDLGYGDVRCLNPEGKIATPHMDRLAAEGMRFTDAHSSSAVCTPTRYGIMTGRYNWRSRLKSGVQGGMSPDLIEEGRPTVASFLKKEGYHTACFGKWHLGFDWQRHPDTPAFTDKIEKGPEGWNVDFTKPFGGGPLRVGFEHYFGIAASLDMVPYTFLQDNRVTELPSTEKSFAMTAGSNKRGNTRNGPAGVSFEAVNVLPEITRHAVDYIHQHAAEAKAGKPFFIYLPLNAPHTPIAPSPEWQGKSGISPYADFVMQTDATLGAVLDALEKAGLGDDTLLVMTSDNGCSDQADLPELAKFGHNPNHVFRGHKADIFDGGHHIPFIARWPGHVAPSSTYKELACLNDWFATVADVLKMPLPKDAAEDSVSLLPALRGEKIPVRKHLIHHSVNGSFALRQGQWKLILTPDSGGWSAPTPGSPAAKTLPAVQLYDLNTDIGEEHNLEAQRPELVAQLTRVLLGEIANGSTRTSH